MKRVPKYLPLDLAWETADLSGLSAEEVKNKRKKPPKGYPSSRGQYADPKNLKYPIDNKHIRAAVSYYNKQGGPSSGGYAADEWASIGRRIAAAANRLIGPGHSYSNGKIQTKSAKGSTEAYDPDHDGDDDSTAKGDTDHDYVKADGTPGPKAKAQAKKGKGKKAKQAKKGKPSQEEVAMKRYMKTLLGLELVPPAGDFGIEEVVVNGEPCFRWQAMVIPADAISRNTIPGKKGPTYYSGRRMQQYYQQNTKLLEEMKGAGQKVTVYPRHAAAMLDAAQPLGWVERYFLKPSARGNASGAASEDMWYEALAPLNNPDARGALANMRTGLTQFSSLRSFPSPRFQTEPVKLNGRVVEEAISLPIAGVDLVATAPGLPVAPIQLLEEAAVLTPYVPEPVTPSGSTADRRAKEPSMKTKQKPAAGGVAQHKCASCGTELTVEAVEEIAAAHADTRVTAVTEELKTEKARRKAAEEEVSAMKKAAEKAGKSGNGASEEVAKLKARIKEQDAKHTALEAEVAKYADVRKQVEAMQAKAAVEEKLEKLLVADKTMGKQMRPIAEEALAKAKPEEITLAGLGEWYYKLRADSTDRVYALLNSRKSAGLPGYGFTHGAGEEDDAYMSFEEPEDDEDDESEGDEGDEGAVEEVTPPAKKGQSKPAARQHAVPRNPYQREVINLFGRARA